MVAASYPVTGREGFLRFCSANLHVLDGTPWFLTGEESTALGSGPAGGRGGVSVAVNALTGRHVVRAEYGRLDHENVYPVTGLRTKLIVTTEDGPAGQSQLYAFTAPTWRQALRGVGRLWVWKADAPVADGDPSTDDIGKGQALPGRFVPVSAAENADADTLEAAAQAKGAFDFVRLEDIAQSATDPAVLYFNDTGSEGAQTQHGRLYQLRLDRADPTRSTLRVLLDGDAGDDIVNPDNLDASAPSLILQEDRNSENRGPEVRGGYGRVLRYDLRTGKVTPLARVATPATLSPGSWESSGVLDAARFYGPGWWLLDVQAHDVARSQPGLSLQPDSSTGEDGQLLAMHVPGS